MSKIVTIGGSRAVGKSTLLDKILLNDKYYFDCSPYQRASIDDLFENGNPDENKVVSRIMDMISDLRCKYLSAKNDNVHDIVFLGWNPEYFKECLDVQYKMHNLVFPKAIFKEAFKKLDELTLDLVIYLKASQQTIEKRWKNDGKYRKSPEIWFKYWFPAIDAELMREKNVIVINTDGKKTEEIYRECTGLLTKLTKLPNHEHNTKR